MKSNETARHVKVADETWIATALLHREFPDREDFTIGEIVKRASVQKLHGELRPGVRVHAAMHCVANREPNPGRYRMLLATGNNRRRLYRTADPTHPLRKGKITPRREDIPKRYHVLLEWYEKTYARIGNGSGRRDPILALRGYGKEIWGGENPDAYVRRMREGWE